ncbi:xanthine uracil permease [Bifidobacterium lemurum]|uniref:Xanthine uracil permease n=1 Tax=Bifidobacterium lemurum TaxID=1603886 RepID=A0A261FRQ4_9BIFI|nr:hypothetical protein [Bifidobacterium lemurum]OZG61486.1 xanthine uracil permease [Bifidobacterium lemurum]QOL35092.1 hypothetical protein BL8807_04295 [Bifidobacterium lemurum]
MTDATVGTATHADASPKQPGKLSLALNKRFHFLDRGSNLRTEIGAGFGSFSIAVCALLLNTQVIGASYGNYAGPYLALAVVSFLGTVLLGVLCNLPLVQSANMGLSTVLISMITANEGLTYSNVLAITFVAAVIYLAIAATPARRLFTDLLPESVRKALPVGIGIYIMMTALRSSGMITDEGQLTDTTTLGSLQTYYLWLMAAGVLVYVLYLSFRHRCALTKTYWLLIAAMWVGGILFFLDSFIGGQTATTLVYERVNTVVATDGASPYNIVTGVQSLDLGALFTSGFDFSGFTAKGGNVPLVFVQGVLSFLLIGMYTNMGTTSAAAQAGGFEIDERVSSRVHLIGAALNVVAPVLGASPTSVGAESSVGSRDGAKSGLSSLVAALGYFVSMFAWVFVLLTATKTNGVGMWISETETKLAAYVQDGFVFADFIMVLVGVSMLKGVRDVAASKLEESLPFLVAVAGIAVAGNIALGVAFGVVSHIIAMLVCKRGKELTPATLGLGALLLVYGVFALI